MRSWFVMLFAGLMVCSPLFAQETSSEPAQAEAPAAEPEQPALERADSLPWSAAAMLWARGGDDVAEGIADALLPLWFDANGLLAFNPRFVLGDEGAREVNLGLVARRVMPGLKGIVGANCYYDYRRTESEAEFNQLGVGMEYLGKRFDLRANYYIPENDTDRVNEQRTVTTTTAERTYTDWDDPYAQGNTIVQEGRVILETVETTARQTFYQLERALEGWDAELGVPVPMPNNCADVHLYAGYYDFQGEFGADDVSGMKARIAVNLTAELALTGEWYEDEDLYGSEYFVGARLLVPFDFEKGLRRRKPADGEHEVLQQRLFDPVERDVHVQTEVSQVEEDETERSVSTVVTANTVATTDDTLATDVIFVNNVSGNDANPGTVEEPVATIDTGIGKGDRVFVMNTTPGYDNNVVIAKDLDFMGQGYAIGNGGRYLNGDSTPTVLRPADPKMPTIWVDGMGGAGTVSIRGFDLRGCVAGGSLGSAVYTPVIIAAENVNSLTIHDNRLSCGLLGILSEYDAAPTDFFLDVHDNTFADLGMGALVLSDNRSGSVQFNDNLINRTGIGAGVAGFQSGPDPMTLNVAMTGNRMTAGGLSALGQLVGNTNGLVSDFIASVFTPLPAEINDALRNLPPEIPSLLGLGAVGLGSDALTMNAEISGNWIEDTLIGTVLGGYGQGTTLNGRITGNTMLGGGTDALFAHIHEEYLGVPYTWSDPFELSLAGILVGGVSGVRMDNMLIANNTVSDQILGITALGFDDVSMNDLTITGNRVLDSWLGITVVGEAGTTLDRLRITDNTVDGAGLGELVDVIQAHVPSGFLPPELEPLLTIDVPDLGIAGILVESGAIFPDPNTSIDDAVIAGNTVSDHLLGIGVIGGPMANSMNRLAILENELDDNALGILTLGIGTVMRDMLIAGNTVDDSLLGITVAGLSGSDFTGLQIIDNTVSGGGLNTIRQMITPFIGSGAITDPELGALLQSEWPIDGLAGVLVLGMQANADDIAIVRNDVDDMLLGIGVAGTEVDMNNGVMGLNDVDNALVGLALFGMYADMEDWSIVDNDIDEAVLGILTAGYKMSADNLVVSRNTIGQVAAGIGFYFETASAQNVVMDSNVIQGGLSADQLAFMVLAADALGLNNEIADMLGMDDLGLTFPADVPATGGFAGFVGGVFESEASLRISNNDIDDAAFGSIIQSGTNTVDAVIQLQNNTASGPYVFIGDSYTLLPVGNTPVIVQLP